MLTKPRTGSLADRMAATTRILVVEDEGDIAEFMRAYFRASGYDLVHVDPLSPAEVIEAVDTFRPDCVLLDLYLRGFSGRRAYEEFRGHPAFDHTPVIVVTAMVQERESWPLRPIDGFVAKPFRIVELEAVVADRIEAARTGACASRDPLWGFTPPDDLHAHLTSRIHDAWGGGDPVALGIVQLRDRSNLVRRTGEMAADFVLRELAYRLSRAIPSAHLARHGGSELAIAIDGLGAGDAAEALRAAVDAAGPGITLPGGTDVEVDVAIGLALCPEHAANADQLWMAADIALAAALELGSTVEIAR